MAKPSKIKIDVTKLLKQHFYKGKKGTYCTLVIWENRDGADEYGNTHSVKQEIPKEARDAGEQEPYVGNGTIIGPEFAPQERGREDEPRRDRGRTSAPPARDSRPTYNQMDDQDDIPF